VTFPGPSRDGRGCDPTGPRNACSILDQERKRTEETNRAAAGSRWVGRQWSAASARSSSMIFGDPALYVRLPWERRAPS
jgi:hypothetical protein